MSVKVKTVKADELEIESWALAAKSQKVDGKESVNNWIRHHLNKAAKRYKAKK
jgi:IS1 family transposase